MKRLSVATLAAIVLSGAASVSAQDMAGMPGMKMPAAAPVERTGKGVGIVEALDPAARTITLKHGPIPTIGWPAMTMTFKVDTSATAAMSGLKVGQPVGFDVKAAGMSGLITALRPQS